MDIEKELKKIIRQHRRLRTVSIIFLALAFPFVGFGVWFLAYPIVMLGGLFAVVGAVCLTRSFLHPQYNNLHRQLDGYKKNGVLHITPSWGKSEKIDKELKSLENRFYSHGASLLNNRLSVEDMTPEHRDTIVRVISDFEKMHKNSFDDLCMAYANMAYSAELPNFGSTNIIIKRECIFRCLLYNMKYGFGNQIKK